MSDPSAPASNGASSARALWPEWLVSGAVLLAFGEALFTRASIFARDSGAYCVPIREWWRQEILSGRFPEWIPGLGFGAPYLANPGYQFWYPPQLLLLLPLPGSHDWYVVGHVLFAGLGSVRLARRLGTGSTGAAIAGLGFALGGYLVSMTANCLYACGPAYLPWLMLAGAWLRAGERGAAARFALLLGLQITAGELQSVVFGVALAAVGALVAPAPEGAPMRRSAFRAALGLGTGVLVAAAQLVPTWAYGRHSERSGGVPLGEAELFSTHPLRLLNTLVEAPFGRPFGGPYFGASLEPGPFEHPWAYSLYFGAASAVLVPFAFVSVTRTRRTASALTVLAALAVLAALGRYGPVYALLHRFVPLFDVFRYPEKVFAVVSLLVALVGGIGADAALATAARGGRGRTATFVALVALVALVLWLALDATFVLTITPTQPDVTTLNRASAQLATQISMAALVAAAALAAVLVRREALLVAVCAMDLAVAAVRTHQPGDVARATLAPELVQRADGAARAHRPLRLFDYRGWYEGPMPEAFEQLFRVTAKPDRALAHGVQHVIAYTGASVAQGTALMRLLGPDPTRVVRLASVAAVVTDAERFAAGRFPGYRPAAAWGNILLLEPPDALPHAYVLGTAATIADDAQAAALIGNPAFPLERVAVLIGTKPEHVPQLTPGVEPPAARPCVMRRYEPTRVVVACRSESPGVAVLAEQFVEGWTLRVDGEPAPIERVQFAYRGAVIGPGVHTLEFRYRTPGLAAGLWGSLFGLLALAGLVRRRF